MKMSKMRKVDLDLWKAAHNARLNPTKENNDAYDAALKDFERDPYSRLQQHEAEALLAAEARIIRNRLLIRYAMQAAMVLVIATSVLAVTQPDIARTVIAFFYPIPEITAAHEGELLIVLASLEQQNQLEEQIELRLSKAVEEARRQHVNVRLDPTSEVISSRARARAVAEEFGAGQVIWSEEILGGLLIHYEFVDTQFDKPHFQPLASPGSVNIRINDITDTRYLGDLLVGQAQLFEAQYEDAIPFFNEAVRAIDPSPDREESATSYFYLGLSLTLSGQERDSPTIIAEALTPYETALQFFPPDTSSLGYAATLHNLGFTYMLLAQNSEQPEMNLQRAINAYQEALQFFTPDTFPLNYAFSSDKLGRILLELGNKEDACLNWRKAETTYLNAGTLYQKQATEIQDLINTYC
jgi:tetratricopeptide (TPR) repeat protein